MVLNGKKYVKIQWRAYIFKEDVEYPKDLHDLLTDLPFLPETMKTNKFIKLVSNLYDKITMLFT